MDQVILLIDASCEQIYERALPEHPSLSDLDCWQQILNLLLEQRPLWRETPKTRERVLLAHAVLGFAHIKASRPSQSAFQAVLESLGELQELAEECQLQADFESLFVELHIQQYLAHYAELPDVEQFMPQFSMHAGRKRSAIVSILRKIKDGASSKFVSELQARHTWKSCLASAVALCTALCEHIPPSAVSLIASPPAADKPSPKPSSKPKAAAAQLASMAGQPPAPASAPARKGKAQQTQSSPSRKGQASAVAAATEGAHVPDEHSDDQSEDVEEQKGSKPAKRKAAGRAEDGAAKRGRKIERRAESDGESALDQVNCDLLAASDLPSSHHRKPGPAGKSPSRPHPHEELSPSPLVGARHGRARAAAESTKGAAGKDAPRARIEDSDDNAPEDDESERLSGDTALAARRLRAQAQKLRSMDIDPMEEVLKAHPRPAARASRAVGAAKTVNAKRDESESEGEDESASEGNQGTKLPAVRADRDATRPLRGVEEDEDRKRNSKAAASSPRRALSDSNSRKRVPWTDEEVDNLRRGMAQFAEEKHKWALILKHFEFQNRTTVDLKDKWRNLLKAEAS